jgi:hypothetical protein
MTAAPDCSVGSHGGSRAACCPTTDTGKTTMNQIIYIVGAVVIVLALLSFVGLR